MFTRELKIAKEAARAASKAILRHYKTDLEVIDKGGGHPVTKADHEANAAIREIISTNFPDDGWLSEEDADDPVRLKKNRLWVIDPLDGTKDFIRQNPEFGVSIALVVEYLPVLGVVLNPATDEIFYGCRGGGVFQNGEPVRVSASQNGKPRVLASQSEFLRGEWDVYKDVLDVVPTGGTAYKMALVASGRADACFTLKPKSEWDICAGYFLVTETGGRVTTATGDKVRFNNPRPKFDNLLYSNGSCHEELLNIIHNQ